MSLFLLGIPVALASAKMLKDDIKYTRKDYRIPQASSDLQQQYIQIRTHIKDILEYSGAKCDFKKESNRYRMTNTVKGGYGGLERYLMEKGYYREAIEYAKSFYDNVAEDEHRRTTNQRDKRIQQFEEKLMTHSTEKVIVRNKVHISISEYEIKNKVEQLTQYFNMHHNDVYCNIIMGRPHDFVKHEQVWHIRKPTNEDATQYFKDVCDKLNMEW